jgi:hypothetical protein
MAGSASKHFAGQLAGLSQADPRSGAAVGLPTIRISCGAEAGFALYHSHSQKQVDQLRDLFLSNDRARPKCLRYFGEPLSGRRSLLRAATSATSKMGGRTIGVERMRLSRNARKTGAMSDCAALLRAKVGTLFRGAHSSPLRLGL